MSHLPPSCLACLAKCRLAGESRFSPCPCKLPRKATAVMEMISLFSLASWRISFFTLNYTAGDLGGTYAVLGKAWVFVCLCVCSSSYSHRAAQPPLGSWAVSAIFVRSFVQCMYPTNNNAAPSPTLSCQASLFNPPRYR